MADEQRRDDVSPFGDVRCVARRLIERWGTPGPVTDPEVLNQAARMLVEHQECSERVRRVS